MIRAVFSSALMLWASPAFSQCATGVDTGGTGCVPPDALGIPRYGPPGSSVPRPRWADRWGAIVYDTETGQAGTVTGYASRDAAVEQAMSDCREHGALDCRLRLAYRNQCAAVAWGAGRNAVAGAATEKRAQQLATEDCGDSTCKAVYSACSLPEQIQ